jgi:glucose-6-phosphate dehydrogenase assembly protein OpcA
VCCEQIMLTAHGADRATIPNVLASLLVPDVPSVLLWKAAVAAGDPLLLQLCGLVDKMIIDSSEEPEPSATLRGWNVFARAHDRDFQAGDLAWAHLTPWRSALAHLFDAQNMRDLLRSLQSVETTFTVSSGPPHSGASQGLLLYAWLHSRLGWTARAHIEGDWLSGVTAGSTAEAVSVTFRAVPVGARRKGPGGLEEVKIVFAGGAHVLLASADDHASVRTRIESGGKVQESVLWVRDRDERAVLAAELEVLDHDRVYEEALLALDQLFGGI